MRARASRYVYIVYHRDNHLRVYANNQPKETLEKANRVAKLLSRAREMEQFYKPGHTTLAQRRRTACEELKRIELQQVQDKIFCFLSFLSFEFLCSTLFARSYSTPFTDSSFPLPTPLTDGHSHC
jgi:hypothetical protein